MWIIATHAKTSSPGLGMNAFFWAGRIFSATRLTCQNAGTVRVLPFTCGARNRLGGDTTWGKTDYPLMWRLVCCARGCLKHYQSDSNPDRSSTLSGPEGSRCHQQNESGTNLVTWAGRFGLGPSLHQAQAGELAVCSAESNFLEDFTFGYHGKPELGSVECLCCGFR